MVCVVVEDTGTLVGTKERTRIIGFFTRFMTGVVSAVFTVTADAAICAFHRDYFASEPRVGST